MKLVLKAATAVIMLSVAMPAFAADTIKIWMGGGKSKDLLQTVVDKFAKDLGVTVVVEEVDPLVDKFQQAAATGDGPDIVLWAHDRFGEWAAGGLISPITPNAAFTDGILPSAVDAVTFGGKMWGYPIAVEAVGLIYNKDLVPTPPATFEEIKALKMPAGKTAIMWDYNNTYFTMPMLMANGGFAFKKVDGTYNGKETGVNNEGAMASGTMPKGVDYGVMDGAMNKGEVAMVINGPWAWGNLKTSKINFGVAPVPSVNGKPSPSFLGVYSAAINAASKNKDLAIELIENFMLTDEGLAAWNGKSDLGALADKSAAAAQTDPNVQATLINAGAGIPMPSNPEMGAFWSAMGPALANITTGAQSVEDSLNDAAKRILAGGK
jgi:maltose/maltodextrin transport system substrate-binding protein